LFRAQVDFRRHQVLDKLARKVTYASQGIVVVKPGFPLDRKSDTVLSSYGHQFG
jgi:hypothetical protein